MRRRCVTTWAVAIGLSVAGAVAPAGESSPDCSAYLGFLGSSCPAWRSRVLPETVPPARGNRYADREDAALLGMKIFFDNRFSRPGSGVACVSCHDPEHAFAERRARSNTIREVSRNAPDLIDAAWYSGARFWDGKVDTLWSAPLYTLEQDEEMGSSRLHVAHVLADIYKARYERIFGPLPDLADTSRFPGSGKPGDSEFDAMSPADREAVNRIYANAGKSLEAYIRRLAAARSPFDAFMTGSEKSLNPAARRGMIAFERFGCGRCHSGAAFTDEKYHNLGLPPLAGRSVDPGRRAGAAFARSWPFDAHSRFADPPTSPTTARDDEGSDADGAFRTPSLRNVAATAPYGHDGTLGTLEQAIDAHARVLPVHTAPKAEERSDLVEFLRSLSGRPPPPPWNYWPGG